MSNETFGDVVYSYSRAQAIADGVLVDLTAFQVVREHWKFHLACTDSVWNIVNNAVENGGADYDGMRITFGGAGTVGGTRDSFPNCVGSIPLSPAFLTFLFC